MAKQSMKSPLSGGAKFLRPSGLAALARRVGAACDKSPSAPEREYPTAYSHITAFVGTGQAGLGDEGLDPLASELYLPQDLTFGPDDRPYILDWNNHRVRVIDAGVMRTLIGTGQLGDAPDGPALAASLNHPTHISFDPLGRLIMSAWHNSKIMRYDFSSGRIESICGNGSRTYGGDGGPANRSQLNLPSATAFDPAGRMYISDQENQRIRMVDLHGVMTTVAGTGSSGFSGDGGPASAAHIFAPEGQSAPPTSRIATDYLGNLYLADTFNNRIRMVDLDGIITTVAGPGRERVDPNYGVFGDGGPATQGKLLWPCDIAIGSAGTLFIADTFNNCIRMVDRAGIITTVAGQCGMLGYMGDGGYATEALLNRPYGIALDKEDNLYIADTHNHLIRVFHK